jgi:hypothetical protein
VSTDIAFLQDLRADLMRAATSATAAPRRSAAATRARRRPIARWKLVGAMATSVVLVAGVVGFLAVGPGAGFLANENRPRSIAMPRPAATPINDPVGTVRGHSVPGLMLPGDGVKRPSISSGTTTSDAFKGMWSAGVDVPAETPALAGGVPAIGPSIVKTGAIEIEVARDAFAKQFQQAMAIAEQYGGYVQTSSTSGTKTHSGTLVMRVPADRFSLAIGDLRELGTVLHQEVSGVDVTAQFVDLGARLKNAQAQEVQLRKLLAKAPTVDATLRVNRVLSETELKIEELQGQLRVLQNRADLGTIRVLMSEKGAKVVPPIEQIQNPKLGPAIHKSVAGFLGVIFWVVVGIGYLLPVIVVGLVAWFVIRRVRRSRMATA